MIAVSSKATLARDSLRGTLTVENTNSILSEAEPSFMVRRLIYKMIESISGSNLVLRSEAEYSVGIFLANDFLNEGRRYLGVNPELPEGGRINKIVCGLPSVTKKPWLDYGRWG